MTLSKLPALNTFIHDHLHAFDEEHRAYAQNFYLEERASPSSVQLYEQHIGPDPVDDLDDWNFRHNKRYARAEVNLPLGSADSPRTFRPENSANRLNSVSKNIDLIRVENLARPCKQARISIAELAGYLQQYQQGDPNAAHLLEDFCNTWNQSRDKRPMFATTYMEVEDILTSGAADWADQLRDRLGLGHFSPQPGKPVNILLTRYKVGELYVAHPNNGAPAVPTVLDSDMSPFFHPSPIPDPTACPDPCLGATVNLAPVVSPNDYQFGCELLHPRLDYSPEHLYRIGHIVKPVSASLEQARSFHLPWLQLESGRDDYAF